MAGLRRYQETILFLVLLLVFLQIENVIAEEKDISSGAELAGINFKAGHLRVSVEEQKFSEIMDEVARVRPDFKDPSAAVSNGLHRFRTNGLEGSIKEGDRKRKARGPRKLSPKEIESREERLERKRERVSAETRRDEFLARPLPKLKRVLPVC